MSVIDEELSPRLRDSRRPVFDRARVWRRVRVAMVSVPPPGAAKASNRQPTLLLGNRQVLSRRGACRLGYTAGGFAPSRHEGREPVTTTVPARSFEVSLRRSAAPASRINHLGRSWPAAGGGPTPDSNAHAAPRTRARSSTRSTRARVARRQLLVINPTWRKNTASAR